MLPKKKNSLPQAERKLALLAARTYTAHDSVVIYYTSIYVELQELK